MTNDTKLASDQPQAVRFGVPVVLMLVLLAVLTLGLLLVAVTGQDRIAREASQTIARAAFNAEKESLESLARDYSWWNAAVENLIFELNPAWIEENLDWLPENFGVSRTFVFGPGRERVYASLDTEPIEDDNNAWRNPGLVELIAAAEALPELPDASVTAYVRFSEGVHLVSASALLEETDTTGHPPYPDKGILVVTRKIDAAFLREVEADFQLPGLTLQADPASPSADAFLPLASANGDRIARVVWTPPRPGTRLLEWLMAPLGLAFVLVGAVVALIIARARRAGLALQQAFEARVAAQKELEYSARHDSLTDLPNRALFLEHLTTAIAHSERYGSSFSLHYLDLDGFKPVNDTHGHPAGDELLRELAARLRTIVRSADTIARFGGDEFAVLQRGTGDPDGAGLLAARMVEAVARPFEIADTPVHVTLSIGIAFDTDGEDAEEIIRKADRALYRSKNAGGSRFQVYDAVLDERGPQPRASHTRSSTPVGSNH